MSRARLAAAWLLLCRAGPWTANAQAVKAAEAAVARDAHDDANAPNAAAPPRRRSYFVNLVVASEDRAPQPFLLVNVQYFLRHAATHSAQADAEYKVTMNGPCPETRRLLREHAALVGPQAPLKRAPVRQLQRKNFGYDFGGHLDALAEEAACCPRGFEGHTACLWLVGGVDTSQKSPSVVCGTSAAARAAAASGKTRKNAAPAAGGAAPRGHRALEAGDVATGDVATGDVAAGALEARKTAGATAPRAAVAMAARAAASGNGEKFRRNLHWSNLRYDGYILLNCGVRGPIYPTYMPRGWHWLSAFEDKMTALGRSSGGVALVGTSLACLDEPAAPSSSTGLHFRITKTKRKPSH
ncbi:hypothetical protein M885DRAFT_496740 [Pelagophyceae sp. CCMP2097]|nr:hypothetical protein M885DRAFT_496740 [Pelagophyceae sp. CCMP2097]